MRESGILMPVSSLPGPYGIGCFGKEAEKFVDFLAAAGQKIWQILPLSPTGYGDSPYQSCSAFAGNPYFIDLDALKAEGLLTAAQLKAEPWGKDPLNVDYGTLYTSRYKILRAAYAAWRRQCAASTAVPITIRMRTMPSRWKTRAGWRIMLSTWPSRPPTA